MATTAKRKRLNSGIWERPQWQEVAAVAADGNSGVGMVHTWVAQNS